MTCEAVWLHQQVQVSLVFHCSLFCVDCERATTACTFTTFPTGMFLLSSTNITSLRYHSWTDFSSVGPSGQRFFRSGEKDKTVMNTVTITTSTAVLNKELEKLETIFPPIFRLWKLSQLLARHISFSKVCGFTTSLTQSQGCSDFTLLRVLHRLTEIIGSQREHLEPTLLIKIPSWLQ